MIKLCKAWVVRKNNTAIFCSLLLARSGNTKKDIRLNYAGNNFIEVGKFIRSEAPLEVTFDTKPDKVTVELKLYNSEFKKIGESVYLVTVNGAAVYVGEYSKTLGDRWFKKDDYIWHNKDIDISNELKSGSEVKLHLLDDPFATLKNGIEINVAKSIEHQILQTEPPKWNKRNKSLNLSSCVRLSDITKI